MKTSGFSLNIAGSQNNAESLFVSGLTGCLLITCRWVILAGTSVTIF